MTMINVDNVTKPWDGPRMTMTTRTIVEDIPGSLNRRYLAEVDADDEVKIQREGVTVAEAARKVVAALRYKADDAERKFIESGVLPALPKVETVERKFIRDLLKRARRDALDVTGTWPLSIQEALNLLSVLADDHARIE